MDTAWSQILRSSLGLETGRPDVLTLLRWTLSAESIARYARLPDDAKLHVSQWISETSGPIGELVMRCVDAGNGLELCFRLGLYAELYSPPPASHSLNLQLQRFAWNATPAIDEFGTKKANGGPRLPPGSFATPTRTRAPMRRAG